MKSWFALFLCTMVSLFAFERSVVNIYKVGAQYDYLLPWYPPGSTHGWGSGFVSQSGYIITNAHVVENALFLQVKLACDPRRFQARVVAIGHDCDLAILKVDDPLFSEIATPLPWARKMPVVRDSVVACGFPMGGEHLAVTEGSVARFEVGTYANQGVDLMLCQLDVLASPGSSGGPVLNENNEVIGLIHQGSGHGQRIAEMIPLNIIAHFLAGVERGEYKGFFSPGFAWGKMEGAALRHYCNMSPEETGIFVTHIAPGSPADKILKPSDVICAVNNNRIYNDGTYEYQKGQYLDAEHLFKSVVDGTDLKIDILRDGKHILRTIPVDYDAKYEPLVPLTEYGKPPTYFIYGGFVFQPLTRNFIHAAIEKGTPAFLLGSMLHYLERGEKTAPENEVVILSRVLCDECNMGYHHIRGWVIDQINGERVNSMRDAVRLIEENERPYLIIQNDREEQIIVERAECNRQSPAILKRNQISSNRSVDLN